MPTLRSALLAAGSLVALTGPLLAQRDSATASGRGIDTTADVLVLDHDFSTGTDEFVRVFFESRQVYRGELNSPDVTLQIRFVGGRVRPPRVYSLVGPGASSGSSIAEIYPDVDGMYEIRPVTGAGSGVGSRLRLYRDVSASHRRTAILNRPGWEIGLELATGWHSGFAQSNGTLPASAADPHGGSDVEACFSARSAPGISSLSMCVFGIGYQSQVGAKSILWFFTEPRLRLLGKAPRGRSGWELGALFRVGLGSIQRSPTVPWIFAPGAYVARQIHPGGRGTGWSIRCSYHHAIYDGFPRLVGNTGADRPQSDRLSLGLGWYQ
jgi:hypothetical protein